MIGLSGRMLTNSVSIWTNSPGRVGLRPLGRRLAWRSAAVKRMRRPPGRRRRIGAGVTTPRFTRCTSRRNSGGPKGRIDRACRLAILGHRGRRLAAARLRCHGAPTPFRRRFRHAMRDWCNQAGLPHCSAHGLRKATPTQMAEAGATAHELMAVTGHRSTGRPEDAVRPWSERLKGFEPSIGSPFSSRSFRTCRGCMSATGLSAFLSEIRSRARRRHA